METAIAPAGVALLAYGGWLLSRGVANEAVVGVTFGCLTLLRGLPPSIDA